MANLLNVIAKAGRGRAYAAQQIQLGDSFVYKHLGSMATVGRYKAFVDLRQSKATKGLSMAEFVSWIIWRSAYLTRLVSWRNRLSIMPVPLSPYPSPPVPFTPSANDT
ncbi:NAD(P)H dehydrogenase B2 [Heracleum sosnowskyi]|uniref:NADH:ubiquinone reductase (non-electrogenic) n=1 Tax=Heracleum sosnowskyi TaxID=360622 RepID=A0AAD8HPJ6_9APIA|nr:NAD(P)H dehydrogenase B2 [Heracleum sosnowskyi]